MRIECIEASRHKRGRVLVFLEDGVCLKITEQELLDFGLRAGDELDTKTLDRLKEAAGVSNVKATAADLIGKRSGETVPSKALEAMAFGSYNKRVEHKRTVCDWLTRDNAVVDAYMADPLCGFTPSAGLFRDMLSGIRYIQKPENLNAMKKDLPVFFIAGGDDPVGSYGKGVRKAAEAFRQAGMEDVTVKLYPLCRHEILNEINKEEVYQDVLSWIEDKIKG